MPHTHTFLKDFGRALIILGERSEADGQAWHLPNDMPRCTQRDMIQMFAEEAGVPAKISSMSKLTMKMVGLFIPKLKKWLRCCMNLTSHS